MVSPSIILPTTSCEESVGTITPENACSRIDIFTSAVPTGVLYVVASPVRFTISDRKDMRLSHHNGLVHRAQFVSDATCVTLEVV
jgi:hypothetical protein